MEMNIGAVDLAVIIVYLIGILFVGLWAGAGTKDLKDYAIANKVYGVPMLLMTVIATHVGGNSLLGRSSLMYRDGLISIAIVVCLVLCRWMASVLLFKRLNKRFDGMISAGDIILKYYGHVPHVLSSIAAVLSGVGVTGVQIMAISTVASTISGLSKDQAVIFAGIVTILYSSMGGIRAVAVTDAVQFVLLISILPIVGSLSMYNSSFSEILQQLPEEKLQIIGHKNTATYLVMAISFMSMYHFFTPHSVQRYLMAQNKKQMSRVYRYSILSDFIIFFIVFFTVLATIGSQQVPGSESVILVAIDAFLPPFLKGAAIVAVLSVIMSTLDSCLNSAGIMAAHNVFRYCFKNGIIPNELLFVRGLTLLVGVGALYFALVNDTIFESIVYAAAVWKLTGVPGIFFVMLGFRVFPLLFWINGAAMISSVLILHFILGIKLFSTLCICPAISIITCLIAIYIYNEGDVWDPEAFAFEPGDVIDSREMFKRKIPLKERLLQLCSISRISNTIRESVVLAKSEPMVIASFICVLYTIPFFMWNYHDPKLYPEMVVFRLGSASLASIVFFKNYWSPFAMRYFPHYWYFTLFFALGYTGSYMLICEFNNPMWVCNSAIAMTILMVTVPWQAFLIMVLSGFTLALTTLKIKYLLYGIAPMEFGSLDFDTAFCLSYIVGSFLLVGVVFAGGRQKEFKSKIDEADYYVGEMAHEAKAPTSSMAMSIESLLKVIENHSTEEGSDMVTRIPEENAAYYKQLLKSCAHTAKYAVHELDTIMMTSRKKLSDAKKEKFSVKALIEESISTFPIHESFKGRIIFEGERDFKAYGCRLFVRNVFYNMYRNAIAHALTVEGNETLHISVEGRCVKFEDNGKGIKKSELPYIFERFHSSSSSATGLGLSFCERVMLDLGGYIECKSEEGVGTVFVLCFPK